MSGEEVVSGLALGKVLLDQRPWVLTARSQKTRGRYPSLSKSSIDGGRVSLKTPPPRTRCHSEVADKSLTSVQTHTCAHAHTETVPITLPPLQVISPGESWQGGQKTIWKETAAPEQNAEPLHSKEARCQPAHTKDPHPSHPGGAVASAKAHFQPPPPRREVTPSQLPLPARHLTSSLLGTSSLQWRSWLPSASPSDAGATCCPPNPPDLPQSDA